jgi:ribosomal protein S18 acetylase RimI-like enzyme
MKRESSRVRFRKYGPTDRKFVEQGLGYILAEKASAAPDHEITPAPDWGRFYAPSLVNLVRESKGVALVVEVDGDRAGFAFGSPDRGIPRWMQQSGAFSRRCTILEVHVDPRFRRLGLGPRLVAEVERRFAQRGYDWITASYHQGHRFEAGLYRKCGYGVNSVSVARWLTRPVRR